MLVISVKEGRSVQIGEATVLVTRLEPGRVRLAIDAPEHVQIVRYDAKKTERKDR